MKNLPFILWTQLHITMRCAGSCLREFNSSVVSNCDCDLGSYLKLFCFHNSVWHWMWEPESEESGESGYTRCTTWRYFLLGVECPCLFFYICRCLDGSWRMKRNSKCGLHLATFSLCPLGHSHWKRTWKNSRGSSHSIRIALKHYWFNEALVPAAGDGGKLLKPITGTQRGCQSIMSAALTLPI